MHNLTTEDRIMTLNHPVTTEESYLAAILSRLSDIHDQQQEIVKRLDNLQPSQSEPETIEIREPVPVTAPAVNGSNGTQKPKTTRKRGRPRKKVAE